MRAWPCPMFMTRRKIITQTKIGNKTRPIKAKLRNASCLWDTHQRNLRVLDFIRRSPPCPWNIVQHDYRDVNDTPSAAEMQATSSRALAVAVAHSATRTFPGELGVVIRVRIVPGQIRPPITPFAPPAPRYSSCESPASGIGRARSIPREQRSGKSEQRRGYPSPGTPLW